MKEDSNSDYQIIDRKKNGESMKYHLTLKMLQPNVDPEKALIVNYADMQFKLSPHIYDKMIKFPQTPHFGYTSPRPSFWQALSKWVNSRYDPNTVVSSQTTTLWNNMLTVFTGVMHAVTQQNDGILLMVPTYYRYISDTKYRKRRCVQFELSEKDNRLYIDFQKLEQTFKKQNIKLFILANPWNPCGRIWSKDQLTKLKDLLIKYKIYIFSDQIFGDAVQPQTQGQKVYQVFTSMLNFPDLYPYLIYGGSHSKTYNVSGMALSYTIVQDKELFTKINNENIYSGTFPSTMSYYLIQVCYTDPEANKWRIDTIKYIRENFNLFKSLSKEKLPKMKIYDLQCSYLVLIDLKDYQLNFTKLQEYFSTVNLCPTFMRATYVDRRPTSLVRLNLACNRQIIKQIVQRLVKTVNLPKIE